MGVSSQTAQTSHSDLVRLIGGFRGPYDGFIGIKSGIDGKMHVYRIIWEFIRIYVKGLEFGL